MTVDEEIKEYMRQFSAQYGPIVTQLAMVKSVNENDTVVVQLFDDTIIDDVRLKSIIKAGNEWVLIPEIQSLILIGKIGNSSEWAMFLPHSVTAVKSKIGEQQLLFNKDGLQLKNEGETLKDALVKIIQACEQILVLQGNNPNYQMLSEAKTIINKILH